MKYLLIIILLLIGVAVYAALPNWIGCDAEPANVSTSTTNAYSYIYDEQATDDGHIDSAEAYIAYSEAGAIIQFGIFENTAGNTFRDTGVTIEFAVEIGLNKFTIDPPMVIKTGQYLGFFLEDDGVCSLEKETSGGGGYRYLASTDAIDSVVSDNTFTLSGNSTHDMQLRAYVTAVEEEAAPMGRRRKIILQ